MMTAVATTAVGLEVLARLGKALAHPVRRALLVRLASGPAYPGELAEAFGLSKTNLSNQLACLRGCGLVRGVFEGRRVRYEVAHPRLGDALAELAALVLPAEDPACGPDDGDEGCPR